MLEWFSSNDYHINLHEFIWLVLSPSATKKCANLVNQDLGSWPVCPIVVRSADRAYTLRKGSDEGALIERTVHIWAKERERKIVFTPSILALTDRPMCLLDNKPVTFIVSNTALVNA